MNPCPDLTLSILAAAFGGAIIGYALARWRK